MTLSLRLLPLLLLLLLQACATTPPSNTGNLCSIFEQKRGWQRSAEKASQRWGTPVPVMMAIMHQESSFRHDARPPRKKFLGIFPGSRPSSAYGYSQALDGTWADYQRSTGKRFASRSNFSDSIDFIGWYTNTSTRRLNISPNDAYNQYLAYHDGHGGYARRTYMRKSWLLGVARRVDTRAGSYTTQLQRCRR